MDHTGAIVGPVLATIFLLLYPDRYRVLFGLTIVPGAIAVALIFLVSEPSATPNELAAIRADANAPAANVSTPNMGDEASVERGVAERDGVSRFGRTSGTSRSSRISLASAPFPRAYTNFMFVLALFTLGNSTDAFLLLRLTDAAGSVRFVPLMWAALHVVKASTSMIAGSWSDRIGRRTVIAIGWLVYAVVYGAFAWSTSIVALFSWFLVYGFYFGFAEGTEKALVADLAPAERRGFAFGVYNAVIGLGSLAASLLFGFVWNVYGTAAAFGLGSVLALAATGLLFAIID
jgi:hypothetical protein